MNNCMMVVFKDHLSEVSRHQHDTLKHEGILGWSFAAKCWHGKYNDQSCRMRFAPCEVCLLQVTLLALRLQDSDGFGWTGSGRQVDECLIGFAICDFMLAISIMGGKTL